jgi:hypothetical protein
MMERLTGRTKYGEIYMTACDKSCPCADKTECNGDCDETWKVIEKLADYEDLEEHGLLVKLPCKVGDTVYTVELEEIQSQKVGRIIIADDGIWLYDNHYRVIGNANDVFFAKSEAEQALAKIGGEIE